MSKDNKITTPTTENVANTTVTANTANDTTNTNKTVLQQVNDLKAASSAINTNNTNKAVEINAKYLAKVPNNAFPVISDLEKLKADILVNGTEGQKALVSSMDKYLDIMAPGKAVEPSRGAMVQYSLWRTIKRVLEEDPREEFKGLFIILLAYFKVNINGCFALTHRYRFTERWTKSQAEFTGLNNILNLLAIACEDNARRNINKEVHLTHALSTGFKDEARIRVLNFFSN